MDDIKASAAQHHQDAAHQHEAAATMHAEAARHCAAGNFEKAERLGTSASEAEALANRHAMQALNLYRHHAEEVTAHKAEADAEEAARTARHDAKAAAKE